MAMFNNFTKQLHILYIWLDCIADADILLFKTSYYHTLSGSWNDARTEFDHTRCEITILWDILLLLTYLYDC